MPIKRNGLGKGLDSLIPDKNVKPEAEAKVSVEKSLKNKNPKTEKTDSENTHENPTGELMLNINEVEPNRGQPRKEFDEDALLELADSVRQYGILQPLIVQKNYSRRKKMARGKACRTKRGSCYHKRIYISTSR